MYWCPFTNVLAMDVGVRSTSVFYWNASNNIKERWRYYYAISYYAIWVKLFHAMLFHVISVTLNYAVVTLPSYFTEAVKFDYYNNYMGEGGSRNQQKRYLLVIAYCNKELLDHQQHSTTCSSKEHIPYCSRRRSTCPFCSHVVMPTLSVLSSGHVLLLWTWNSVL